jgi:hypothetical protein
VRFLPETANRDDWPRLVAQIVNRLVRRQEECCEGGGPGGVSLELDGGDAEGSDGSIEVDGGDA